MWKIGTHRGRHSRAPLKHQNCFSSAKRPMSKFPVVCNGLNNNFSAQFFLQQAGDSAHHHIAGVAIAFITGQARRPRPKRGAKAQAQVTICFENAQRIDRVAELRQQEKEATGARRRARISLPSGVSCPLGASASTGGGCRFRHCQHLAHRPGARLGFGRARRHGRGALARGSRTCAARRGKQPAAGLPPAGEILRKLPVDVRAAVMVQCISAGTTELTARAIQYAWKPGRL